MPRKNHCYWTRTLELQLVEFIRKRDFIWQYTGNTNHHIQQKYKAYAEFAANLGPGYTARSVRDRWVNIRNTFNYNLRKVDRSKETAKSAADIYIPSWPLWKPLQFLREVPRKEDGSLETYQQSNQPSDINTHEVKEEELQNDIEQSCDIGIRQRGQHSKKPSCKPVCHRRSKSSCKKVLDDLIEAMSPLVNTEGADTDRRYHYFGKYVSETLNSMRTIDAESACRDIRRLLASGNENAGPLS